eukprot:CAMPEP_0172449058 /NCGR_PEP_ID=MMETSP1065-20121228/7874_1 /TAXON_ID=265537 /ORGANISM="Amphiprora paludosa, Strain CCMP125" /LENGTH=419 /DNA_ID=CAMNT_0013200657 /DNA_START=36 /DNA_END=1292 /DNA_ORIENTATION=-
MRYCSRFSSVLALWVIFWLGTAEVSSTSSGSLSTPPKPDLEGIPRSTNSQSQSSSSSSSEILNPRYPPWNPSRNIGEEGFLKALYTRIPGVWEQDVQLRTSISLTEPCHIRQVPGDGNCLFHSISVGLCHAVNRTQWDMKSSDSLKQLYHHSQTLRQQAVACLQDSNRRLCLQGQEWVKSRELVEAAAQQYGLTAEEYCRDMQQESVWGGGPEIVALANVLKRPIHVYELTTTTKAQAAKSAAAARAPKKAAFFQSHLKGSSRDDVHREDDGASSSQQQQVFVLRRMACFGSPRFDRRSALHILSADSRFPDIAPGQQLSDGNHFLAVFPTEEEDAMENRRRKKRKLRGGGSRWGIQDDHDEEEIGRLSASRRRSLLEQEDDRFVSRTHSKNNNLSPRRYREYNDEEDQESLEDPRLQW